MSDTTQSNQQPETSPEMVEEIEGVEEVQTQDPATEVVEESGLVKELNDRYLRLAAEYDNFRRRSQKEKSDSYTEAKTSAILAFLPVYDNLERALKQDTVDEAYKKGVELTMTDLKKIMEKLGVVPIEALGQPFDPNLHNAVVHVEDPAFGENTVAEVFQSGFKMGETIIRFAMVKVAN